MSHASAIPATQSTPERAAYSMREVAKLLGVSDRHVWTLVKSGRIRHVRAGYRVLITPQAIAEFLGEAATV